MLGKTRKRMLTLYQNTPTPERVVAEFALLLYDVPYVKIAAKTKLLAEDGKDYFTIDLLLEDLHKKHATGKPRFCNEYRTMLPQYVFNSPKMEDEERVLVNDHLRTGCKNCWDGFTVLVSLVRFQ